MLEEIEAHICISKEIKKAIKLTKYAVQTRYPGEYDDITKEDYEESLEIAKKCIDWVESEIGKTKNENVNL